MMQNMAKPVPEDAIKCQPEPDPVTGHLPCWRPYDENNPNYKWFGVAYKNVLKNGPLADGTYEAIGNHFNGNMYKMDDDTLVKHGTEIIEVPRTFEGIKEYLRENEIEGIVFWLDGEPKCKIKRSDFGFEWQPKKRIEETAGLDSLENAVADLSSLQDEEKRLQC